MSFVDLFAWIVLAVVAATIIPVFVAIRMMSGRIAPWRGHP